LKRFSRFWFNKCSKRNTKLIGLLSVLLCLLTMPALVTSTSIECFEFNAAYSGDILFNLTNVASAGMCQESCQGNAICNYFVYDALSKICSLLNESKSTNTHFSIGLTSGQKYCNLGCLEEHTDYRGIDLTTIILVTSPYQCQRHCQKNDECSFFTYNHVSAVCILKSMVFKIKRKTFLAATATSGAKICTEACFDLNVLYQAETIKTVTNVTNAMDCQTACQIDLSCQSFTYNEKLYSTSCLLKNVIEMKVPVPSRVLASAIKPTAISGPKFCHLNCHLHDIAYVGNDIRVLSNITSVNPCQRECQLEAHCLFFSFSANENICSLKANITGKLNVQLALSGPKFCWRCEDAYVKPCLIVWIAVIKRC